MEHTRQAGSLFAAHQRSFDVNRYVYPVLSRRAGGISIGVNLNLDKVCNFDCIYCQVDRTRPGPRRRSILPRLVEELERMVDIGRLGANLRGDEVSRHAPELRRLNDIAFSGDGEPTTYPNFPEIVAACAEVRSRHGLTT